MNTEKSKTVLFPVKFIAMIASEEANNTDGPLTVWAIDRDDAIESIKKILGPYDRIESCEGIRLNLTQHASSPGQFCEEPKNKELVSKLLTFDIIPNGHTLRQRADELAVIAAEHGATEVMIGGAPYFMSYLEKSIIHCNMQPCYAFSKRESVDEKQPDGSIKKTTVFKHDGFIYSVKR